MLQTRPGIENVKLLAIFLVRKGRDIELGPVAFDIFQVGEVVDDLVD